MADIKLICPHCGKEMFVSEHVSVQSIPCVSCKQQVPLPGKIAASTNLGLRKQPPHPAAPEQEGSSGSNQQDVRHAPPRPVEGRSVRRAAWRSRQQRKAVLSAMHLTLSVIVFIVLGAALLFMRFFHSPALLKEYGVWVVAFAYLAIIIASIKDNMFDALLCLVVPLYAFYYLFMVSSAVYLRAVVGAILIAFGYDFAVFIQIKSGVAINSVNTWIRSQ